MTQSQKNYTGELVLAALLPSLEECRRIETVAPLKLSQRRDAGHQRLRSRPYSSGRSISEDNPNCFRVKDLLIPNHRKSELSCSIAYLGGVVLGVDVVSYPELEAVVANRRLIRHASDVPVLLSAMEAKPDWLLTHNTKHFTQAVAGRCGLRIATPVDFFETLAGLFQ